MESSIAIFDAEIARIMVGFNTKLESMTGIGTTLAAAIFSEIGGDIKKFSSMSKRGSPYLRRVVWLVATVALSTLLL